MQIAQRRDDEAHGRHDERRAGREPRRRPGPDDGQRRHGPDQHAHEIGLQPVRRRAAVALGLPLLRFGHAHADQEDEQGRQRARDHQQPPGRVGQQVRHARLRQPDAQEGPAGPVDHAPEPEAQEGDEQEAHVRRGADQPSRDRPRLPGPEFVDERHTERPFAPHPQRRDEAEHGHVPGLRRKAAQAGEHRIREDAQRHRADAADRVAEPAEEHAARGGADEEHGDDRAKPFVGVAGRGGRTEQVLERRPTDQRKEPHLEPVEQPAEHGGDERGVAAKRTD